MLCLLLTGISSWFKRTKVSAALSLHSMGKIGLLLFDIVTYHLFTTDGVLLNYAPSETASVDTTVIPSC